MKTIIPTTTSMLPETKGFEGIELGFSDFALKHMEIERPFTRSTGETLLVTMSRQHWDALAWLTEDWGYDRARLLDGIEIILPKCGGHPFSQVIKWWIELTCDSIRERGSDHSGVSA